MRYRGVTTRREGGMNRARTWSVLSAAAALIAACTVAAVAEDDEPGNSRWPIKTTISATADQKHPRDVPLASLLELGTVPRVKGNDRRYQAQRIPAEAFGNPLGLAEGDIVRTTGLSLSQISSAAEWAGLAVARPGISALYAYDWPPQLMARKSGRWNLR